MQLGDVEQTETAAERARVCGVTVFMDRCPLIEDASYDCFRPGIEPGGLARHMPS